MNDFESVLLKRRFKHLYAISESLPNCAASSILQTHLLTKCRQLQNDEFNCELPQFKSCIRCPRCCMPFSDGPATIRLIPDRKNCRFTRRLVKKYNNNVKLTKCQLKAYKKHMRDGTSKLKMTCCFCEKITFRSVVKPEKYEIQSPVVEVVKSSKKKRKRDRFSGLNESVMLSLTPQRELQKYVEVPNVNDVKITNCVKDLSTKNKKKAKLAQDFVINKRLSKLNKHMEKQNMTKSSPKSKLKNFLESI